MPNDSKPLAGDNAPPQAVLVVRPDSRWAGETFVFDAKNSTDAGGHIVRYLFDFGDGVTHVADSQDGADPSHSYAEPGNYTVTVLVTDNGTASTGALTDTDSLQVAVNVRMPVQQQVIATTQNMTPEAAVDEMAFNVTRGVERFEMDIEVRSLLLVGSTSVRVTVLGPNGEEVATDTVDLAPGAQERVVLDDDLDAIGEYTLRTEADSGAASVNGELRVYYG